MTQQSAQYVWIIDWRRFVLMLGLFQLLILTLLGLMYTAFEGSTSVVSPVKDWVSTAQPLMVESQSTVEVSMASDCHFAILAGSVQAESVSYGPFIEWGKDTYYSIDAVTLPAGTWQVVDLDDPGEFCNAVFMDIDQPGVTLAGNRYSKAEQAQNIKTVWYTFLAANVLVFGGLFFMRRLLFGSKVLVTYK